MKRFAIVIVAAILVLAMVDGAQAWKPEAGKDYVVSAWDGSTLLWYYDSTQIKNLEINPQNKTLKFKYIDPANNFGCEEEIIFYSGEIAIDIYPGGYFLTTKPSPPQRSKKPLIIK